MLAMPSREYYLKSSNDLSAYHRYMTQIAILLGADKETASVEMQEVIDFEVSLAKVSGRQYSTRPLLPWIVSFADFHVWNRSTRHIFGLHQSNIETIEAVCITDRLEGYYTNCVWARHSDCWWWANCHLCDAIHCSIEHNHGWKKWSNRSKLCALATGDVTGDVLCWRLSEATRWVPSNFAWHQVRAASMVTVCWLDQQESWHGRWCTFHTRQFQFGKQRDGTGDDSLDSWGIQWTARGKWLDGRWNEGCGQGEGKFDKWTYRISRHTDQRDRIGKRIRKCKCRLHRIPVRWNLFPFLNWISANHYRRTIFPKYSKHFEMGIGTIVPIAEKICGKT